MDHSKTVKLLPSTSLGRRSLTSGFLETRVKPSGRISLMVMSGRLASSSVTSAIVLSGLSADSFIFLGFFPRKNKQKQSLISRLKNETSTMIFFESTKRIKATINYISDHIDQDRQIVICREISKKYEEVLRGNKSFFKDYLNQKDLKGEIVLLIEGSSGEKTIHIDEGIKKSYLEKLSPKDAAKLLALVLNKSKREI